MAVISLHCGRYFSPANADRILLQTSGDISNGTECFNRPDLLSAAWAETVSHLCLAAGRKPHKLKALNILSSTLTSILLCAFISAIK